MHEEEAVPLALVSGIYEAALAPEQWGEVLGQLRRYLDASSSLLWQENLAAMEAPFVVMDGLDPSGMQTYYAHYISQDPSFGYRLQHPLGTISLSHRVMPERELMKSEFYCDFLQPLGLRYTAGMMLERDGPYVASFGVQRALGQAPFEEPELARLRALLPHLRRGYQIGRMLATREQDRQAMLALLERLPVGVLLLDEQGRAVFVNRRAQAILAAADGLLLTRDGLAAHAPDVQAALEPLLRQAVRTGAGLGTHAGGALSVPSATGHEPYQVLVTPLVTGQARLELGHARVCAAVFVQLRDAPPAVDANVLRELFGLTHAETRVALALVQGRTPREIAAEAQSSRFTVRAQLSAVYAKLGVNRQAEAVQRILSGPAALGGAGGPGEE